MKITVFNFNGIYNTLVNYLSAKGELEPDWKKADVLVMWQDVLGEAINIAKEAKAMKKKVVCGEHGLMSINDYVPPLSRELLADKYMCWGNYSRDYLIRHTDIDPNRLVVTGTTIFDGFGAKKIHQGKNILFAPRHWDVELNENLAIVEQLKKLKGVRVLSKIVAGEHNPDNYLNPIATDRQSGDHLLKTWQLLANTDVLVTVGEGTIACLAYYMNVPVVSSREWEDKVLLGKLYTQDVFNEQVSYACHMVSIKDLNKTIMSEIKHPKQYETKRLNFLNEYVNYGSEITALERQLKVIYE